MCWSTLFLHYNSITNIYIFKKSWLSTRWYNPHFGPFPFNIQTPPLDSAVQRGVQKQMSNPSTNIKAKNYDLWSMCWTCWNCSKVCKMDVLIYKIQCSHMWILSETESALVLSADESWETSESFESTKIQNPEDRLTLKDNAFSYCFTLFDGPCQLSSSKRCSGDLSFLYINIGKVVWKGAAVMSPDVIITQLHISPQLCAAFQHCTVHSFGFMSHLFHQCQFLAGSSSHKPNVGDVPSTKQHRDSVTDSWWTYLSF